MAKVMVDLQDDVLSEAAQAEIEALKKQVKSLTRKLQKRDEKICKLQEGADFTRERRQCIGGLADSLIAELRAADWATYDEDWG